MLKGGIDLSKLSVIILFSKKDEDFMIFKSIQKQTLKDMQVIVADALLDEEGRVKLEKYNQVQFSSKNTIKVDELSGEYVAFLTSENQMEEDWAEKMYEIAKNNELDLAICGMTEIEKKTNEKLNSYRFKPDIKEKDQQIACANLQIENKIVRKKILNTLSEIQLTQCEIFKLYLNKLADIKKVGYISDILCQKYVKKNEMNSLSRKDIETFKEILKETKQKYKENKIYNEKNRELLSAVAFIHLGVNMMDEISRDPTIDFKLILKDTINYLDINFFEWRNNKILSSQYMRKQHLNIWIAKKMYKTGFENLYISLYKWIKK